MDDTAQYVYAVAAAIVAAYFLYWRLHPLYHIPAIGPSAPLVSYLATYKYYRNAREALQEGYNKHKVFRVPMIDRWLVVVSGADMNEELRRIPDTHVSFLDAAEALTYTPYTIAHEISEHPIHVDVIRERLTRNLNAYFEDIVKEISAAFPEVIAARDDDWVAVSVLGSMARIVSRASNRVFVGLPFCRDPDYLSTVVNFTYDVSRGRYILNLTPGIFKGVVGELLPWSRRAIRKVSAHIMPTILERQQKLKEYGEDWVDKPTDYLMWLIEAASKFEQSADLVVQSLLVSNFAAIHTSSNSITHSIYNLAAYPEYMQPLREEVATVIREHGWTKAAMGKMMVLDSFMKESQRLSGINGVSVMRKVVQDLTLSDGTHLPRGTLVVAAATATHLDDRYYDNPTAFNPFRFSDLRKDENGKLQHQFVQTSPDFITFGHGKHACPGRFFAVNELKIMMAYIILNYDLKFEGDIGRPDNRWFWHAIVPANVNVLFRKRRS